MKLKKVLSLGLTGVMALSALAFTGCGSGSADGDNTFSWWITMTDGQGVYYDSYEDNPGVQWLNQQYWDAESGGLGTEESGTNIQFTFDVPISGSESDNFNTMLSTGDYSDIIDLAMASDTAPTMVEEGILMDITEYVEKYMPNYIAYLEENPDVAALVTHTDEDGNLHYYQLASIKEENEVPWGGYMYRRDWVVKYCEPSEYVWDWDSAYVQENGHPAVTPLEDAIAQNNLEGWKENPVDSFQVINDGGDDPDNNYEDNVIFPSGTDEPLTISDWEWMLEAFDKALTDRGWADNTDAYGTTVYYPGFFSLGDLVSSFGGGGGMWSKDADQNAYFNGDSDNFKAYVECLNTWYENGWLDTRFETRASDMFFSINESSIAQGMVGLFYSTTANLGDTIRVTCQNAEDAEDAYVMPCAVPINDVYGSDAQKYVEPDAFYQGTRISGRIGLTTACEEKSEEAMAALFTFFNWMYTEEGALTRSIGLSKEQLESCELENNLYEEYGLTEGAYTETVGEDGKKLFTFNYDTTGDIGGALRFMRMVIGMEYTGAGADIDYSFDKGSTKVVDQSVSAWTKYTNTADVSDFQSQFTSEQNDVYTDTQQVVYDYMCQHVPALLKEGLDGWDAYVSGVDALNPGQLTEVYQQVSDALYGD